MYLFLRNSLLFNFKKNIYIQFKKKIMYNTSKKLYTNGITQYKRKSYNTNGQFFHYKRQLLYKNCHHTNETFYNTKFK